MNDKSSCHCVWHVLLLFQEETLMDVLCIETQPELRSFLENIQERETELTTHFGRLLLSRPASYSMENVSRVIQGQVAKFHSVRVFVEKLIKLLDEHCFHDLRIQIQSQKFDVERAKKLLEALRKFAEEEKVFLLPWRDFMKFFSGLEKTSPQEYLANFYYWGIKRRIESWAENPEETVFDFFSDCSVAAA